MGKGLIFNLFPVPKYLKMPAVGVDVSDRSFKYMELCEKKGQFLVSGFGTKIIPEGIVESGEIKDKKKFTELLKSINSELKIKFINASLPEEKAFISRIELPLMDEENIRNAIEFQLEEHIPMSASDAIFDFEIIKKDDKKKTISINVAACPKALVESYRDAFLESGFLPLSFEMETQSFARSLVPKDTGTSYFLVDFGKTRTSFAIVNEGKVKFSSSIKIGGDKANESLSRNLNIDIFAAENLKKERGLTKNKNNEKVFESLLLVVSVIKDEIKRNIGYWNSYTLKEQGETKNIEKVLLCGGDSNLAGLPEYLSYELKIPVELGNPWVNIFSFKKYVPDIELNESLTYAVALGLALKSFYV